MTNTKEQIINLNEEAKALEMALFYEKAEDTKAKYRHRLDEIKVQIVSIRDHERNLRMHPHESKASRRVYQRDSTSFVQTNINPGQGALRRVPMHNDQISDSQESKLFTSSPPAPMQTGWRRRNSNASLQYSSGKKPNSNATSDVVITSSSPSRDDIYSNRPANVAARSSMSHNQHHNTIGSSLSYVLHEREHPRPSRLEPPISFGHPISYNPASEKALERRGRRRSPRRSYMS